MLTGKAKQRRLEEKQRAIDEELLQTCSHAPISFQKVQSLVQQYPSAAKATNSKGDLPLHLACFNGASLQVVEYLVVCYPSSLKIKDQQGSLPLHWACFGTAPLLVIQNLLLQYPESISVKTQNGQVPLHYACHGAARLDVVKVLVNKWPDGAKVQNVHGLLPLHILVSSKLADLQVVQYLVQQYPQSLSMKDGAGQLPIDRARTCGAQVFVVEYLSSVQGKKQPSGMASGVERPQPKQEISRSNAVIPTNGYDNNKKQDTHATIESKLLHVCSESNVTVQDIAPLLQQDPDAIMTKTQKEMRPLHIACWKGASVDVVEYLIQAWPDSVMARTTRQWIPLHVACAASNADAQVQLNVIKCLVQHSPESTKAKDNKERIPLHVACFSKAPLEVVQYLVQEWPDSVMAMNNYESLPLHLACGTCADLSVIQFLVKCKPESLDAVDSEGRTAYDMAKHPLQSDEPDEETVAWLHNVLHSRSKQEKKKQGHFEKERGKLKQVITGEKEKPVAVSSDYVEAIMQGELGKGYFGVVFMGNDTVLKQQFAIKKINRKILVGGNKDDLECVKKEFKREQKGLLRFRHPNIALLYGYCLSDSQRKGEYLLYELAEKGSLDTFWNSQVGRERLSLFGRRANIALDAFIGIRFLHIGNKYIKPCFHRDIKSANIVLKSDMTAQLIDCGLATFAQVDDDVNQTAMSTGVKGTRGYVCPKYCTGSISYDASCDIFSFGIVLAELWSGQLQNHRDANGRFYNFYEQYINEGRSMDEDLDKAFGFGIGDRIPPVMNEYKHLALDCMAKNPKKRPTGEEVMDRLEIVWHSFQINGSEQGTESGSREASMEESESQSESSSTESNAGGEEAEGDEASDGAQAQQAVNSAVKKLQGGTTKSPDATDGEATMDEEETMDEETTVKESMMISRTDVVVDASTCQLCRTYTADEGSDACLMCLALREQRELIAKTVSVELDADPSALRDFHYPKLPVLDSLVQAPFSPHVDVRLNNPIPRLFCIVPEALKGGWKHPRLWLRRQVATRYNLFFICAHTYQVIHPPVQVSVSSAWMQKIALSLGMSLTLLRMAASRAEIEELAQSQSSGLKLGQVNEMIDEVQKILKDQGDELHILERIQSGIRLSDKDISLLNGETYELICEKAREDRDWRRVMEPVRKQGDPHIVWVSRIVAMDPDSGYDVIYV